MSPRGRSQAPASLLLALALAAVAVAAMGSWAKRRFERFEVAGESMTPALRPGDFVIVDTRAYRGALPRRGDVVLARDPREPERVIVKRVEHVDLHGGVWLTGDNLEASTDSRSFGPVVRKAIIGRVRWRYWPLGALSRVK